MLKYILPIVYIVFLLPVVTLAAPSYYIASNIPILIEGPTAVDSRDQALLKAQKLALSQFLPPESAAKLSAMSDMTLGRTMKDFSLQNERVLSASYQAQFTIRFDPTRFEGLLRSYNLPLPVSHAIDLANFKPAPPTPPEAAVAPPSTDAEAEDTATPAPAAATSPSIIVLPVLNTGSKLVLWDEVNAWRDAWQQQPGKSTYTLPLGDIADVTDAPDTGFLKQKDGPQAGLDNMLKRYNAQTLYLALAQNQTVRKGLSIKLYRYHDQKLEYKGQMTPSSRPGYLFNDAATATAVQIGRLEQGQSLPADVPSETVTTPVAVSVNPTPVSSGIILTIPIPNLSAWIYLQQQLRQTPGVTALVTQSISSNQAVVRIDSPLPTAQLTQNIQGNGFVLQAQDETHYTLYKRTE